ncbi:hypothetical protein HDE_09642 [Halotydeus destructor]|nr:hypothetical protein HDE_09642 [Halotydeus destructor]
MQNPAMLAFTAADEIRCRLLDHKQFTGGEVRYFVKEFEGRRDWKDETKLNCAKVYVEDACKLVENSNNALSSASTSDFEAKIDVIIKQARAVLEQEAVNAAKRQGRNEERKTDSEKEMSLFEEDIGRKMSQIDEQFVEKESELVKHYERLERNLKMNGSSAPSE